MIVVSRDAYILVNGVDLSDHCIQATVTYSQNLVDVTQMGDTLKRFRADIASAAIEATFWNDHSVGSVESTLRSLLGQEAFLVEARKFAGSSDGVGDMDNPRYLMRS